MIFDELGLPKDSGASDWADSCRAAGILAMFEPNFNAIKCMNYVKYSQDGVLVGVRHPTSSDGGANNWKNFTRDQLMALARGLQLAGEQGTVRKLYEAARNRCNRAQNTEADVPGSTKKFPNGADLLMPSHMGHLRVCAGLKAKLYQVAWLNMDILFHARFTPLAEPNQLLAMCDAAGPKYLKRYMNLNKQWREGIRAYWSGWRGESALAEQMIKVLEAI